MKQPILSYDKIKEFIPTIEDYWTRTFIATQYFCAARIGELTYYKHKPTNYHPKPFTTQGLQYERIKETKDSWIVVIPNFKQKKMHALKTCFFLKSTEPWLNNILSPLFKEHSTGRVFPFGHQKARQIVKKELSKLGYDMLSSYTKTFSSHNLRDTRADHLKKIYEFDELDLKQYLGLSSLSNVEHYVKSDVSFLMQKMKQKVKEE